MFSRPISFALLLTKFANSSSEDDTDKAKYLAASPADFKRVASNKS